MYKRFRVGRVGLVIGWILLLYSPLSAYSLLDLNGYDWVNWTYQTKLDYATGYLLATYTVTEMVIHGGRINEGEPLKAFSRAASLRSLSNTQIVSRLNEYYRRNDQSIPLWMALYDLSELKPHIGDNR